IYAYFVTDDKTKEAVIIDPANPKEYEEVMIGHDRLSSQVQRPASAQESDRRCREVEEHPQHSPVGNSMQILVISR
ncbi:Cytoplasmic glyoxalase II, partial [Friedmanniomyces endolithicus]